MAKKTNTSGRQNPSFLPWAATIVTAVLAPLLGFLYFVVVTSDGLPRRQALAVSKVSGFWSPVPGRRGAFHIGPEPTRLSVILPPDAPRGRLTFELYLGRSIGPKLRLVYGTNAAKPKMTGSFDFDEQTWHPGRNAIVVEFDDAPGLFEAERIVILISSPKGSDTAGLAKIRIESFSFSQRIAQAWSRLFAHQALNLREVNFVESNRIAGRGVTVVFWVGFLVAMVVLLLRRFVLRQCVPLLAHSTLTLVVLVVLADLRNSADYYRNARQAVALWTRSETFFDQLDTFDGRLPWFTPTVRFLRENVSDRQHYYFVSDSPKSSPMGSMVIQIAYYARPARRTDKLDEADFALVLPGYSRDVDRRDRWKKIETLRGGMIVFERIR